MIPVTLLQIRERAQRLGPLRLAIAGADSPTALAAARAAEAAGLVQIIATAGDTKDQQCNAVVELAAAGGCDVVLKGSVRTDQLLRAVLDRRHNLRTGRLLSDVLIYEDTLSGSARLVGVTDGGVNVHPNSDALYHIVENAVSVFHALGFVRPRVALLSATEAVSDAVPSTIIARQLANATFELPCDVAGPLALDNALLVSAAAAKGITGPVAGTADILVAPSIEAGNILGKSVKYFGGAGCAHVIVGARVPVLIPSRVESADDKLNSIALGVIIAAQAGR
jgi:phosphate butyryltransferase